MQSYHLYRVSYQTNSTHLLVLWCIIYWIMFTSIISGYIIISYTFFYVPVNVNTSKFIHNSTRQSYPPTHPPRSSVLTGQVCTIYMYIHVSAPLPVQCFLILLFRNDPVGLRHVAAAQSSSSSPSRRRREDWHRDRILYHVPTDQF